MEDWRELPELMDAHPWVEQAVEWRGETLPVNSSLSRTFEMLGIGKCVEMEIRKEKVMPGLVREVFSIRSTCSEDGI